MHYAVEEAKRVLRASLWSTVGKVLSVAFLIAPRESWQEELARWHRAAYFNWSDASRDWTRTFFVGDRVHFLVTLDDVKHKGIVRAKFATFLVVEKVDSFEVPPSRRALMYRVHDRALIGRIVYTGPNTFIEACLSG